MRFYALHRKLYTYTRLFYIKGLLQLSVDNTLDEDEDDDDDDELFRSIANTTISTGAEVRVHHLFVLEDAESEKFIIRNLEYLLKKKMVRSRLWSLEY